VSSAGVTFRRPTAADHVALEPLLRDWYGGSPAAGAVSRLWFRHFTSSSWVAETGAGRIAGFIVGFVSPDQPEEAVVIGAAVHPSLRRHGVGRALFDRFDATVAGLGARRVVAPIPPDDRVAVEFLRAIGFSAREGSGTRRLWGVPSVPDHDGDGQDRAVFERPVASA
jgi:ribosomal protein S18 acetylase RimI-like enzyme